MHSFPVWKDRCIRMIRSDPTKSSLSRLWKWVSFMGSINGRALINFGIEHNLFICILSHRSYNATRSCHTRIVETGHSKCTLLLQLNYGLENSLINRSVGPSYWCLVDTYITAPDLTQASQPKRSPAS